MGTIVVTGSAGGMGTAVRTRLEGDGHTVIGVDVRDADVIADLGTPPGRASMLATVASLAPHGIEGLVAAAGITTASASAADVVSVNYFGAVATLDGLRHLLTKSSSPSTSAIAISSNSSTSVPGISPAVVSACLDGDEPAAREAVDAAAAYPSAKLALARWVRRQATTHQWIGAGIRLNAVAPGLVTTPMTDTFSDDLVASGWVPIQRPGTAEEIAGLLAYLLSSEAAFFVGSVIFMDGGTDARTRTDDWPAPLPPELTHTWPMRSR